MDKKKPPESAKASEVHFLIETEREDDGRWIAEIAAIPGVELKNRREQMLMRWPSA
jgi:Flp pilus assembly CpaF family ATPase